MSSISLSAPRPNKRGLHIAAIIAALAVLAAIARDTMHQQQWLAVIEELGGETSQLPIPNSFPQDKEHQQFSYTFFIFIAEDSDEGEQFSARRGLS